MKWEIKKITWKESGLEIPEGYEPFAVTKETTRENYNHITTIWIRKKVEEVIK